MPQALRGLREDMLRGLMAKVPTLMEDGTIKREVDTTMGEDMRRTTMRRREETGHMTGDLRGLRWIFPRVVGRGGPYELLAKGIKLKQPTWLQEGKRMAEIL